MIGVRWPRWLLRRLDPADAAAIVNTAAEAIGHLVCQFCYPGDAYCRGTDDHNRVAEPWPCETYLDAAADLIPKETT